MRIGLVLDRFEPSRGGRERWTYAFAQRLAARGHEVHVVARRLGEAALRLPAALHRVTCERSGLAFAEAARQALEPLALDVVHDMGTGWFCDVFQPHGGTWASVNDRKLLFVPPWLRWLKRGANRLLPRQRRFRKLMALQYAERGQAIVALSRLGAADFTRFHGVAPERIRVIYNGVDGERFSPARCAPHRDEARRRLGTGPETVLALLVAHNFRLKGVATLLGAMARLAAQRLPVQLVVVGGGKLDPWRQQARRLGLDERVTFVGQVDDPVPYYAAADLYVHPTFYDPCSLVVLEAAACGLPVLTSRYNGAAELFREGHEIALISDPADCGELAGAMRELLDAATRGRMGAAARQTALAHSFERNVDEILAVYAEVLRQRAGLPQGYATFAARVPAAEAPPPENPASASVGETRVGCPRLRGHAGTARKTPACPRRRGHATHDSPPSATETR
ncbi:MAG: glycosyltransferase family 4 protein [Thermoguttaceae bacterium]